MEPAQPIARYLAELYRTESRKVLATLIRLLGDFDLAEEALQEAFRAALEQWPRTGLPRNPRAWLVSTGRFKGIDVVRRRGRHNAALAKIAREARELYTDPDVLDTDTIQDDQLRLIFTCCHLDLPQDGRIALALREVCGLTTEEIARAFLLTPATMTKRIARAKERIPYEVPSRAELANRLGAVLQVVYLVYNEGFATTKGKDLIRPDLAEQALYLGRLLVDLLPEPEALGLLALMLFHESRRAARTDAQGEQDTMEPGADSGGDGPGGPSPSLRPFRILHPSGCHCRSSFRGTIRRDDRLVTDRASLRYAPGGRPVACHRTQPGRRRGHA